MVYSFPEPTWCRGDRGDGYPGILFWGKSHGRLIPSSNEKRREQGWHGYHCRSCNDKGTAIIGVDDLTDNGEGLMVNRRGRKMKGWVDSNR